MRGAYKKTASRSAVWIVYAIIFFEMLYMATPFAIFFYSVYAMPLKALNSSESTAWLVQSILPHFSQSSSAFINALLVISWPLIGIGFVIFAIGFVQVYWAKFRRKGAVLGGIYRYSRHPQYAAWIIFGLGMAIFWSRMIVVIAYVTMLFVYYFLARSEERECLQKFGVAYKAYMQKTGMFFPRSTKNVSPRTKMILPQAGVKRILAIMIVYIIVVLCAIGIGRVGRSYAISSLSTVSDNNLAAISMTSMDASSIRAIISIVENDIDTNTKLKELITSSNSEKQLIFIMPEGWHISELGMESGNERTHPHGMGFITNPSSHGNPTDQQDQKFKVLYSKAMVPKDASGIDIIAKTRAQKPFLIISVDLAEKMVTDIGIPPEKGKYGDIPVPIF